MLYIGLGDERQSKRGIVLFHHTFETLDERVASQVHCEQLLHLNTWPEVGRVVVGVPCYQWMANEADDL